MFNIDTAPRTQYFSLKLRNEEQCQRCSQPGHQNGSSAKGLWLGHEADPAGFRYFVALALTHVATTSIHSAIARAVVGKVVSRLTLTGSGKLPRVSQIPWGRRLTKRPHDRSVE